MLVVKDVKKSFGRKEILHSVGFRLEKGIYGLLGANGAGKTTLIRCMCGIYCYQGEICYSDEKTSSTKNFSKMLGYLPQTFGMLRELKLWDMMEYFCVLKKVPKGEMNGSIIRALGLVNLLDQKDKRVAALSGGMTRRAGIAQALLGNPKVIILDEPTAGLDPEERARFKSLVMEIRNHIDTILLSTHIVEDIEACCNQAVVMDKGDILFDGKCAQLKQLSANKVYVLGEEAYARLREKPFVLKTFETMDGIRYRVLSTIEPEGGTLTDPTLEDGYMCAIKRIGQP